MRDGRPAVALTIGDPNGIGPEVVLKSLLSPKIRDQMCPVLVGPAALWRHHAEVLDLTEIVFDLERTFEDATPAHPAVVDVPGSIEADVRFGETDREAGWIAMQAVERAVDLCLSGTVDGMVTAPISKESVRGAGYEIPGHTEFIAARANTDSYAMMMVAEELRIALVTTHRPLRAVAKEITHDVLVDKLEVLEAALRNDFGIPQPSIGALGLNPHAGDGGVIGREELEIITPVLKQLDEGGRTVRGPFSADAFFGRQRYLEFDAVLAMYHDQGLVPFKTLHANQGINFTAGLPIVRTSPDHGTAFDIAGSGKAAPDSMLRAIELALTVIRRRANERASEKSKTT